MEAGLVLLTSLSTVGEGVEAMVGGEVRATVEEGVEATVEDVVEVAVGGGVGGATGEGVKANPREVVEAEDGDGVTTVAGETGATIGEGVETTVGAGGIVMSRPVVAVGATVEASATGAVVEAAGRMAAGDGPGVAVAEAGGVTDPVEQPHSTLTSATADAAAKGPERESDKDSEVRGENLESRLRGQE